MKKIQLSNNRGFALVDDEDFGMVSKYKWRLLQQKHTSYAVSDIYPNGKRAGVRMHRLILGLKKGDKREGDHRDGDGLNNQRFNLRVCTKGQNMMNQRKTKGSSQYKGVSWHKKAGKWMAYIKPDGKNKFLGYCDSEISAAIAYDRAAIKHFGDFARLNFPERN